MKVSIIIGILLLSTGVCRPQKTEWVKTITEQASEITPDHQVCFDSEGNAYLTLNFKKIIRFGKDIILKATSQTGETDAVIVKLNQDGSTIEWSKQIKSYGSVQIRSFAVDQTGNPLVVGTFQGKTNFDGTILSPRGKTGFFICKYNSDGSMLWIRNGGTYSTKFPTGSDAKAVSSDANGNLYVAALVMGMHDDWQDDPSLSNEERYKGRGYYNDLEIEGLYTGFSSVILKLDGDGNTIWTKTSSVNFTTTDLCADAVGNVYCTGYWINISQFCGKDIHSNGLQDIFVAKVSTSGELIWFKQFGRGVPYGPTSPDTDLERGEHISIDQEGNVFIAGVHYDGAKFDNQLVSSNAFIGQIEMGTSFVAKLNETGEVQWVQSADSKMGSTVAGLCSDANGNAYVSAILNFKKGNFAGKNTKGGFVAKLDPNGQLIWSDDADDRKGRTKVKVAAPGTLAISPDQSYLLQTGNAVEVEKSSTYGLDGSATYSTTTTTIVALSKVSTN